MTRVAMMGSGSWGTAFAMVLAHAGCEVTMWARDPKTVEQITTIHQNRTYHPGIELPAEVRATLTAQEALQGADYVVLAIPSQVVRANVSHWKPFIPESAVIISLIKGIEIGTSKRMSQVIDELLGAPPSQVAIVSGPNLAREIVQRQPTASTVACVDADAAQRVQAICTTNYFRPYWTTDVIGTEIGGSVKNVIAVANGMAVGMGRRSTTTPSPIHTRWARLSREGASGGLLTHPRTSPAPVLRSRPSLLLPERLAPSGQGQAARSAVASPPASPRASESTRPRSRRSRARARSSCARAFTSPTCRAPPISPNASPTPSAPRRSSTRGSLAGARSRGSR